MTHPPPVQELARQLKKLKRGKRWGVASARGQLASHLAAAGWTVEVVKPIRLESGRYIREVKAAIQASWPESLAIEFARARPEKRPIERLEAAEGIKVLVLVNGGRYEPWKDKRGEWHKVSALELERIDYIIGIGKTEPIIQTPAELEQGFEEFEVSQELIKSLVEDAWNRSEPLSLHLNAGKERHLPTLLTRRGIHPEAAKRAINQLINNKIMERKRHPRTELSGLKLLKN